MKLLEKILIPVDNNNDTEDQLQIAFDLAERFHSQLILIRVLPNEAKIKSINSLIVEHTNNNFKQILTKIDDAGYETKTHICYGNEFDQIASVAEKENVNLILISNKYCSKSTDKEDSIDIITEKLIRKSQKPIWTIKKGQNNIPKKILCPIDYSESSKRALTNAIKLARIFGAELHIINVLPPLQENFSIRLDVDYKAENKKLENENNRELEQFIKGFDFIDLEHKISALKGNPYKTIIKYVEDFNIDLLFMGTTGKSYLQRVFIGSVTEMVIKHLPCSIVTAQSDNLLNVKIDADISNLEKHFKQAEKLQETGFYKEAINQLKICLQINDLHIPAISELIKIYKKLGQTERAEFYNNKLNEILRRLWDNKIELEIRRSLKL